MSGSTLPSAESLRSAKNRGRRSSTRCIVTLATMLGAAVVVVSMALARLMVHDHAIWLERSYRNRWAFRDVPTRRGSICDRDGTALVQDRPRFALDLDYDTFRRRNPVGAAIAGAKLLAPLEYDHARLPGAEDAAMRLLELPARSLHADASSRDLARDLRFYILSLANALSTKTRSECARQLLAAVADRSARPALEVLELSRDSIRQQMRARVERLRQLADMLRRDGFVSDLCADLDRLWTKHAEPPHDPLATRTLARSLPFEVAADLVCDQELWLGFRLRPAVTRDLTDAATALPSLPSLLGVTTAAGAGKDDLPRIDDLARELTAEAQIADALPDDVDLPDDALERLTRRATSFLRYRVMLGGRFGRSGVESAKEDVLAGQPGLRFVERDSSAREQLLYHSLDVNPGHDVRVTIDAVLQAALERVLESHARGLDTAMAVIDANSGDIVAIGGRPLEFEEGGRLVPRAVSPAVSWRNAGYVGSLAKPFVLLEQLAAERAGCPHTPHGDFAGCEREYKRIPGTRRTLACDERHGSEGRDPALALAKSCNVFFFQAAEGLGIEGLRRAYARAGWFSGASDGEAQLMQSRVEGISGFTRARVDPQGHVLQHIGIGYGVKASALTVARAYAGLATGRLPTLGLVVEQARSPAIDLEIPAADLALVHEGLRRCVTEGTARSVEGLAEFGVHGKTGTAEVNQADENNAWFAGFVLGQAGRPTLAFAAVAYTVTDHGKESARMVADFLRAVVTGPDGDALRRRWIEGVEDR